MQADIESSMVAAAPFVGADSRVIELPEKVDVCFQSIEPGDAHALQRFHDRLSQRSVYLRFFLASLDREGDMAEYATAVEDSWQGRGLALASRLILAALKKGVRTLTGIVLPENARMLNLLRDLGLPERLRYEGVVEHVEIDLLPQRKG